MTKQPKNPKRFPFDERTETGFPRGSIGDISMRLGRDVRDLLISGTSWDEINKMLAEKEKKLKESGDEGSD